MPEHPRPSRARTSANLASVPPVADFSVGGGLLVEALVRAPRGDLSADERDALDEVAEEPARWLTTEEIRAALGDSPTPKLPGRLAG